MRGNNDATVAVWLSFLLSNMFVRFGDQIFLQIQGTPMGTNCASHLASFYLTNYELNFLSRIASVFLDMSLASYIALYPRLHVHLCSPSATLMT